MQLKEIRKRSGISQSQAARGLNIPQATYNRYENGQRQIPNYILLSMAEYFGVSADEILGRQSSESQSDSSPKTAESRIISEGVDRMPPEDREKALNMLKAVYSEYFDKIEEKMA